MFVMYPIWRPASSFVPVFNLFPICAEDFSSLLHKAEEEGLHGVKICSHLLFAVDSLVLFRANGDEVP